MSRSPRVGLAEDPVFDWDLLGFADFGLDDGVVRFEITQSITAVGNRSIFPIIPFDSDAQGSSLNRTRFTLDFPLLSLPSPKSDRRLDLGTNYQRC